METRCRGRVLKTESRSSPPVKCCFNYLNWNDNEGPSHLGEKQIKFHCCTRFPLSRCVLCGIFFFLWHQCDETQTHKKADQKSPSVTNVCVQSVCRLCLSLGFVMNVSEPNGGRRKKTKQPNLFISRPLKILHLMFKMLPCFDQTQPEKQMSVVLFFPPLFLRIVDVSYQWK